MPESLRETIHNLHVDLPILGVSILGGCDALLGGAGRNGRAADMHVLTSLRDPTSFRSRDLVSESDDKRVFTRPIALTFLFFAKGCIHVSELLTVQSFCSMSRSEAKTSRGRLFRPLQWLHPSLDHTNGTSVEAE